MGFFFSFLISSYADQVSGLIHSGRINFLTAVTGFCLSFLLLSFDGDGDGDGGHCPGISFGIAGGIAVALPVALPWHLSSHLILAFLDCSCENFLLFSISLSHLLLCLRPSPAIGKYRPATFLTALLSTRDVQLHIRKRVLYALGSGFSTL